MSFFTNKHVITAMVVAPVLAIVSYYAVDQMVTERPHKAVEGASYPLLAQSNCRFTSGRCDLKNNDFVAQVRVVDRDAQSWLVVSSEHPLDQINVGFSRLDSSVNTKPASMSYNASSRNWEIPAPLQFDEQTMMMIVLQADNVKYYADTTMAFSEYQTSFNKSF